MQFGSVLGHWRLAWRVRLWTCTVWARAVLAAVISLVAASSALPAAAQTAAFCAPGETPHFANGFADLKATLGEVMGDPVECEHSNATNADSLQQTSTGLSLYHRASNTPEFTDGWNHWALAPTGVASWSGDQRPAFLAESAPQRSRDAVQCVDLGGGACMRAAADLAEMVTLLAQTNAVLPLLRLASAAGYVIRYDDLAPDVLGLFRPGRKEIVLNALLMSFPAVDRAPVLAHELQHVADWIVDAPALRSARGCLATEANAFHTQAQTWRELQGGTLPVATNALEREYNSIAQAISSDAAAFAERLTIVYHDECNPA